MLLICNHKDNPFKNILQIPEGYCGCRLEEVAGSCSNAYRSIGIYVGLHSLLVHNQTIPHGFFGSWLQTEIRNANAVLVLVERFPYVNYYAISYKDKQCHWPPCILTW